ncbi:MAG: CoA transferase, partial [Acetobacteraceae bacterium]|nr:CoA transferase [Acetobacteraceae bacterium]
GGSYVVRVSLAQTAHWFTQLGRVKADFSACTMPTREQIQALLGRQLTAFGELEYVLPVLHMSATPPHADRPPVPLGTDAPVWPIYPK